MARKAVVGVAVSLLLVGPALAADPAPSQVIAKLGAATDAPVVTRDELMRPLLEGYGLNILINLIQLNMAKAGAAKANVVVTPKDIEAEHRLTVDNMFKDSNEKQLDKVRAAQEKNDQATADKLMEQIRKDNESTLDQFLQNQHISRAEFDIVTEANAYLRKQAEPLLAGKISEDNLKQAFSAQYGETVQCRHIQCANVQEINEAKRRLAGGESFAQVAETMSRNPGTRQLSGLLPPFSLQSQGLPQAFKDAAFALKEGEVSDIVQADGAYHLIKLEKRIPPKVMKFEDVKDSIRKDLEDRWMQAKIKEIRQFLTEQAVQAMTINDPVLKQQWDQRLSKRKAEVQDRDQFRKRLEQERENATTEPTTQPAQSDLAK